MQYIIRNIAMWQFL